MIKYSCESINSKSDKDTPDIVKFNPTVLSKDKVLLDQLVKLWLILDKDEQGYDKKYGLFFDDNSDLSSVFRKKLLHSSGYYLKYNNECVGFALTKDAEYENTYWISCLVIDNKYRGKGWGTLFINEIFSLNKPKRAVLRVSMNNPIGIALYRKCGFEPISQVMLKSK